MGRKKRCLFCFAGLVAAPKTALPLRFSWTLLLEPTQVYSTHLLWSNFCVSTHSTYMEINSEFKSVFCSSTFQAGRDLPNRPAQTVASCTHSAVLCPEGPSAQFYQQLLAWAIEILAGIRGFWWNASLQSQGKALLYILLAAYCAACQVCLWKTNDIYSASSTFEHNIFIVISSRIQTTP